MPDKHPINIVAKKYPQMTLPIKNGISSTEEYKNVVLRGSEPTSEPDFSFDERDTFEVVSTPAGDVDVLTLYNREDFEHCIKSLAYRCENKEIPKSMGASTIIGLINWEKIRAHEDDLDAFLSDKKNYLDTIIVLSNGSYSNIETPDNMSRDEWLEKSLCIRKYHELTHFFSRNRYPENKDEIRDEILADMMGIVAAFGYYDTSLARKFLGIEGKTYREGGRLQNYVKEGLADEVIEKADRLISVFDEGIKKMSVQFDNSSIFDLIEHMESSRIGI